MAAGRHGEAVPGSHRQRYADGVAAAQNNGHGRLGHSGNEFRNGKARFHISAHGVEQKQHAVHFVALFQFGQKRQHMLILGGFGTVGGSHVPFNLADDGQAINRSVRCAGQGGAEIQNILGGLRGSGFLRCSGFGWFTHVSSLTFLPSVRIFAKTTPPAHFLFGNRHGILTIIL